LERNTPPAKEKSKHGTAWRAGYIASLKPPITVRPTSKIEVATADQQAVNQGDCDLARKIGKALNDDNNLSTYAHNVKVIARGGAINLKGSAPRDEEKTAIESKALEIASAANVENELTVKSKTEK
jgi:osmotically-inducible protein OsmY